jgi:hypothetical protein|tara:strand:+ start:9802 stop:10071 length:270 start_codon:yes stop_codon:yes gene_type:complete
MLKKILTTLLIVPMFMIAACNHDDNDKKQPKIPIDPVIYPEEVMQPKIPIDPVVITVDPVNIIPIDPVVYPEEIVRLNIPIDPVIYPED